MSLRVFLAIFFVFFFVNEADLQASNKGYMDCSELFKYVEKGDYSFSTIDTYYDMYYESLKTPGKSKIRKFFKSIKYIVKDLFKTNTVLVPHTDFTSLSEISSASERLRKGRGGITNNDSYLHLLYSGSAWSKSHPIV